MITYSNSVSFTSEKNKQLIPGLEFGLERVKHLISEGERFGLVVDELHKDRTDIKEILEHCEEYSAKNASVSSSGVSSERIAIILAGFELAARLEEHSLNQFLASVTSPPKHMTNQFEQRANELREAARTCIAGTPSVTAQQKLEFWGLE